MPPREDIGVLVVDDDATIRFILTELFQDAGYRVDSAEEPAVALRKLAAAPFDMIFSDINMPGMTGLELVRGLREANSDVAVVIMTADATLDTAIEASRLGAQDFLRKPFENLALVRARADAMAKKIREARAREAAVGSLLSAAKRGGAAEEMLALAEKAERLLGIVIDRPSEAAAADNARPDQGPVPTSGVAVHPPKSQTELVGDLVDFPLHELLQLLGMMRKTGVLRFSIARSPEAHVAIVTGSVYAARFGAALDVKAIFRLMTLTSGVFHFHPTAAPPSPKRIDQSTDWLVMEGLRHLDELNALGKGTPPGSAVLRYNELLHAPGAPAVPRFALVVAEHLRQPLEVKALLDALPYPDLYLYQALIYLRRAKALDKMA